jgi:GT2 family glycosyltransferase
MYQEEQSKVSVINVVFNTKRFMKPVFDAIFNQTYKNLEVFAVICGNEDGSKEFLEKNYPQVRILDTGKNLGFAGGNNWAIRESSGEFIQLVNPDLIMEPDYIEKMLLAFTDKRVAAATGKLRQYDFKLGIKKGTLDTTGIVMSKSGRARDRGQHEVDKGQYDGMRDVFAVSGAGPMYRRAALEEIKYCENYKCEYFDEDFIAYWEDVDLSWRLNHCGYRNVYVPQAVGYHGRTVGSAEKGYLHVFNYIKHHNKLSTINRQLNYKNHIFMYLKNSKWIHPSFILREIVMLGYILILETSTLKVTSRDVQALGQNDTQAKIYFGKIKKRPFLSRKIVIEGPEL